MGGGPRQAKVIDVMGGGCPAIAYRRPTRLGADRLRAQGGEGMESPSAKGLRE
jgi:hypothetical protein